MPDDQLGGQVPTEAKKSLRYCKDCGKKTLHAAKVEKQRLGCGFWGCAFVAGNLFLCLITCGLWIPFLWLIPEVGLAPLTRTVLRRVY